MKHTELHSAWFACVIILTVLAMPVMHAGYATYMHYYVQAPYTQDTCKITGHLVSSIRNRAACLLYTEETCTYGTYASYMGFCSYLTELQSKYPLHTYTERYYFIGRNSTYYTQNEIESLVHHYHDNWLEVFLIFLASWLVIFVVMFEKYEMKYMCYVRAKPGELEY